MWCERMPSDQPRRPKPNTSQTASKTDTATPANHEAASAGTLRPRVSDHTPTTDIVRRTHRETFQADAIHRDRLAVGLAVALDGEPDKDEIAHVACALKGQSERLLPYRVEPVVLHGAGAHRRHRSVRVRVVGGRGGRGYAGGGGGEGGGEEGRGAGWETPVGGMDGHLDVRIDVFVRDLVPHGVLWAGQLLSRDDLGVSDIS